MIALLRLRHSLLVEGVALGASLALLARMFPEVARARPARVAAAGLAALVLGAHLVWALPVSASPLGVDVAMVLLPTLALLTVSLLPASLLHAALGRILRSRPPEDAHPRTAPAGPEEDTAAPPDAPVRGTTRRAVVTLAGLALPCAAVGVSASGFASGAALPRVRRIRVTFPALPAGLAGARVLQLSDLHLGRTRGLADLERFLASVERPDLLVVTGDVAEDISLLAPALRMMAALRPRLGAFACLGNHEYFHGAAAARRIFGRSEIDLLVDDAREVTAGGSRLSVLGVDDPIWMRGDLRPRLAAHLARAERSAAPADFRLLLSHRPEGFDPAYESGVDLVLSGHTHGGQIGFHGRSAGERIWPERYLWGPYARGRSRLYTTAGFGDWFPFRPGCPSEAPLVELCGAPPGLPLASRATPRAVGTSRNVGQRRDSEEF